MATINELQTCIDGLTTASTAITFTLLAAQSANVSANLSSFVANADELPIIGTSNIPNGQLVFIEDIKVPVIADRDTYKWLGLDGRVFREDLVATLYTWGSNSHGQIGDGTTISRSSPGTTIGCGTNWCQTSGENPKGAVKTDGTLWTWGINSVGQLGDGTKTARSSPGTVAGGGTTWCFVARRNSVTHGIKTDGTLWGWGSNYYDVVGDNSNIDRCSPVTTVGGGITWCQVANSLVAGVGIKTDGTLWTWGCNCGGVLGRTTGTQGSPVTTQGGGTTWCQADVNSYAGRAVKTDGTLWSWGCKRCGQLGDSDDSGTRCSPGTTSGGGTTWCQVVAGNFNTAAIKTDGTLWTWGRGTGGMLGDGSNIHKSSPETTAGGGTNWCTVCSTVNSTTALKTDGTLWTWGCNGDGQLGDGTQIDRLSPGTTAGGGTKWYKISGSAALEVF